MDCLGNIRFLDALEQPIQDLAHQLWVGSTLISEYATLENGESVWIKRPIGTTIDVRVRSSTSGEYKPKVKIQLVGEKTTFIVRSSKVLLKGVNLSAKDVATGTYLRSTYIVAEGDYLSRVADDNHTTTEELIRLNNLKSGTDIHPRQILKIPVKKVEAPTSSPESKSKSKEVKSTHHEKTKIIVVQQKDTLPLIAKLTDNSVDEIKKLNNLTSDNLSQNQKLNVYDRKVAVTQLQSEKKSKQKSVSPPKVKQAASQNKENKPVARVESSVQVKVGGLLPQACGGEKHYKRTLARIAELHSVYQPYVINLINTAYKELKITWVITDGYRSPTEQNALPSANTNAKALQSYHQYGLAIDIVSVRNGEITYLSDGRQSMEDSKKIGSIGQKIGLVWGGVWKKKDWPHFELHPHNKTWRELKPQLIKLGIENYRKLKF
ncbi:MAG: LysM peptidoglycan-binding domain-containing protein [Kurthia sp.]|uniref:LysM peptidoglycan-binding domain-containing protein n=1 Tax=Acinetobacter terrestris TaxID=2529843 RepID=A0ABX1UZF3_9GAMM|nr:M15 family metallopeptidase [Acinetobacter terrestris]MBQ0138524.1 LysM peptidoglycan-binding domain-containing protein [Candidatus Kurthia equi]NNH27534.1 LysM peptidoglycan-binding domain-containing protein [Acinetobacter terrestris]